MHPEKLWKWLDAVDEDHLDPLDQWGVPPPRRPSLDTPSRSYTISGGNYVETYHQYNEKRNAEIANLLESIPPAGLLLRNGSIRSTGQTPKVLAHEMENESHSKSLIPSYTTNCGGSGQGSDPPSIRKLQMSGREGNNDSASPKRLPTSLERAHVRNRSGALQSTPIVHAEVKDPVAIDCQGAKVVGGYQQNGLQSLPSMIDKLRRYTVAGEGARRALRRSNAQRRPSNISPVFLALHKHDPRILILEADAELPEGVVFGTIAKMVRHLQGFGNTSSLPWSLLDVEPDRYPRSE